MLWSCGVPFRIERSRGAEGPACRLARVGRSGVLTIDETTASSTSAAACTEPAHEALIARTAGDVRNANGVRSAASAVRTGRGRAATTVTPDGQWSTTGNDMCPVVLPNRLVVHFTWTRMGWRAPRECSRPPARLVQG